MDPPQLRLPCEVIERIIGHAGDSKTLYSFSLTCHQLRPRALCLMVGRAKFRHGGNRTFAFVDLLEAKPHLKPLVRSIVADPTEFAPFPLLHILPNLSEIEFRVRLLSPVNITFHPSSLVCLQRFGTRIETLHLSGLSFPNYLSFARVLLAFTNLRHLTCTSVAIETAGGGAPLTLLKQRLSEQMQLKTLRVEYLSPVRGIAVNPFLFSPGLAPSTVEHLKIAARIGPEAFSNLSGWPRLRSLVLRFQHGTRALTGLVTLLEEFHSPELKEVVLELEPATSIPAVLGDLVSSTVDGQPREVVWKGLEHRLLKFSHLTMTWVSPPLRMRAFWACELSKHFPVLSQRGALTLRSEPAFPPGHDGAVRALVISPDSAWIASGSEDCTIILWDANGNIARQWVPHGYEPVRSLAFSPDGRYLVSGADDGKLIVWELSPTSGDARQAAVLEGHSGGVTSCAWSPDGSVIASGSLDATVRLWDAATFLERRVLDGWPTPEVPSLTFSPDGRCLAGGSSSGIYCVWDIERDMLRKSVHAEGLGDNDDYYCGPERDAVARHPFALGNTQLATASGLGMIEVWGVYPEKEKEGRLFALEQLRRVNDVSFSPDGRLLVAAVGNGTVTIWDARSGAELSVFEGHKDGVMKVCFSPCGKYIASASWDGTVRVWRTGDGSCVASCPELKHVVTRCITFSLDGQLLASGARNGTVIIRKMRDLVPGSPRSRFELWTHRRFSNIQYVSENTSS